MAVEDNKDKMKQTYDCDEIVRTPESSCLSQKVWGLSLAPSRKVREIFWREREVLA